jgi:hypothetical protein
MGARLAFVGVLTGLVGCLIGGCGDETTAPDAATGATCSELCGHYLTCVQQANPSFRGTTNALVPCENTCFSASEQTRDTLRTCYSRACSDYIACAMTAGLKLQQAMDAGVDLAGHD